MTSVFAAAGMRRAARGTRARGLSSLLGAVVAAAAFVSMAFFGAAPAQAQADGPVRIGWSDHIGALPWGLALQEGQVAEWAAAQGASIEFVYFDSDADMLAAYAAGDLEGVATNNIDALSVGVSAGVDTTVVMVTGFSNGADALTALGGRGVAELAGETVHVGGGAVSSYVLSRCLERADLTRDDVAVIESAPEAALTAARSGATAAVSVDGAWLSALTQETDGEVVCSSRDLPGEILDVLAIRSDVVFAQPALGVALAGAWFDAKRAFDAIPLAERGARLVAARPSQAPRTVSNDELLGVRFIDDAAGAAAFMDSGAFRTVTGSVRRFLVFEGMLGPRVRTLFDVGIQLSSGDYMGDPLRVAMRFDSTYLLKAAERLNAGASSD